MTIILDNLKLSSKTNHCYTEIHIQTAKGWLEYHGQTQQIGDVCAGKFSPWGDISPRVAERMVACWNAFLGMSLEEVKQVAAKQQKQITPAQKARRVLTDEQVREIRKEFANGFTLAHLARVYGVKRHAISRIVNRQTYKEVY